MALTRKVVRIKVDVTSTFEDDLKDALDAALTGGNWSIVYMERVDGSRDKASFIIVCEQSA